MNWRDKLIKFLGGYTLGELLEENIKGTRSGFKSAEDKYQSLVNKLSEQELELRERYDSLMEAHASGDYSKEAEYWSTQYLNLLDKVPMPSPTPYALGDIVEYDVKAARIDVSFDRLSAVIMDPPTDPKVLDELFRMRFQEVVPRMYSEYLKAVEIIKQQLRNT